MRFEIDSAATFLTGLLRIGNTLSQHQLDVFRNQLEDALKKHYQHHWFPEQPFKGSGYRCLRINHKLDPLIARAASACGVSDSSLLHGMFPYELTMWIDPREVSYRIGENGSICVLYDGSTRPQSKSGPPATSNNNVAPASPNNNGSNMNNAGSPGSSSSSSSSSSSGSNSNNNNHHNYHHHHHHPHHHQQQRHNHHNSNLSSAQVAMVERYNSTCKEIVRGTLDNMMMDPRNMSGFEQIATFVSS